MMTTLQSADLMALLNWLYEYGNTEFMIETPFLQEPIMKARLTEDAREWCIHSVLKKQDFKMRYSDSKIEYHQIRDALIAAGVVHPPNWKDTIEEIRRFLTERQQRGSKIPCISFDTSALIQRYFTLIDRELHGQRDTSLTYRYLLSEGVIRELVGIESKYKPDDIKKMEKECQCDWFDFSFVGQPRDLSRKFWLGSLESHKMRKSGNFVQCSAEIPNAAIEGDKDLKIIESLLAYESEQKEDVIVICEDNEFVARAHKLGLRAVILEKPSMTEITEPRPVDWPSLCDELYVLAVIFGVIRVNWDIDDYAVIAGIWTGKKEEDWYTERLNVRTERERLGRYLEIASRLG